MKLRTRKILYFGLGILYIISGSYNLYEYAYWTGQSAGFLSSCENIPNEICGVLGSPTLFSLAASIFFLIVGSLFFYLSGNQREDEKKEEKVVQPPPFPGSI